MLDARQSVLSERMGVVLWGYGAMEPLKDIKIPPCR